MTLTRLACYPGSGSTRPSNVLHTQNNHRTAEHVSLASRWRGGARRGANLFCLFEGQKLGSFELVRLLSRAIQTGLVSGLSAEYRTRRAERAVGGAAIQM